MNRRILVVEDERIVWRPIELALTRAGYDVVVAESLAAAAIIPGPVDLLLVDFCLPNGDGRDAIRARPGTPVLTMTGKTARTSEADLPKPFTLDELLSKVRGKLLARGDVGDRRETPAVEP